MNAMTNEEYVKEKGLVCPVCRSADGASYGLIDISGSDISVVAMDCWCEECGAEWVEEYKLVGYKKLVVK